MGLYSVWFTILSDLLVNLAAAWFGVAVVFSPIQQVRFWTVMLNVTLGVISLLAAYNLRILAL